ncbi:MAG: anhydro-N-acetylmuramic acid kinase [Wenzhouxiangella sp.]|nr:MAG: anhydro-N-acetylmuramic acid kinase [Wenzhouxiangella sp.]
MAELFIGLISGTSMDGIDAIVCDFQTLPPATYAARTVPFDARLSAELDRIRQDPDHYPASALARLDARLGDAFADAVVGLLDDCGLQARQVRAIGSHGQTVLHRPDEQPPFTLQIGDPHRIAAGTGIRTVADFRRADLAAGGQGAPLAPLLHQALLASPDENRVVVNLGGIANVTILPAGGGVTGFDTGPANCFLDLWYRRHHPDRFDRGGAWAASGRADPDWLEELRRDEYFSRPPPKSTGIEYFSPGWLDQRLPDWSARRPADVQASLLELSAASVADAIRRLPADHAPDRLIVCGGGIHNATLLRRMAERLDGLPVVASSEFGLDPDQAEALLMAWLARERIAGRAVHTSPITGARTPVLAGTVFEPPRA